MPEVDVSPFLAERCKVASLPMSEEQRASFDAAMSLSNQEAPTAKAVRVLKSWGFAIGKDAIRQHRAEECVCYDN